jgi:peroxiredoxin
MLTSRGLPDVRRARITIDYTTVTPDAAVAEGAFAWTPPADAVLARSTSVALAGAEPQALVGQRAAEFTLKDLAGNEVTLAKLRGNVVVLDFWATWCPPCRESMPGLQKLHEELSDKHVKIFAVNLREEPDVVRKYLESSKLTLPVILDADGAVASKYSVSGIPQTVVIGKGGRVQNVFVGFGPQSEQKLREAVQKAAGAAR